MKLRHKKKRPLTREVRKERDDRLFVLATEDTHAPDAYFRIFRDTRIKVTVLPTTDTRSAPKYVFERLKEYEEEYQLNEGDELWLMLDTDHWTEPSHIQNLREVNQEALQHNYHLAHSNPCFEVWLLLHKEDIEAPMQRCSEAEKRLKAVLKGYNKAKPDMSTYSMSDVDDAVRRGEDSDPSPNERWPQSTGTHVYRLVRVLQAAQAGER